MMMQEPQPQQILDLRTTKCPLNFVKAKLALEKLAVGDVIEVWILTSGESAINIPASMAQEGHAVVMTRDEDGNLRKLWIEKREGV